MSKPVIIDELKSLTVSVGAAIEGVQNGDWLKVELALSEVQERTGRLLREIGIVESVGAPPHSGTDE